MADIRTKFRLPYKVKNGTDVLNEYGHTVGCVIGCEQIGSPGVPIKHADRLVDGPLWEIEADIEEAALNGKLQCMEPTFPVQ